MLSRRALTTSRSVSKRWAHHGAYEDTTVYSKEVMGRTTYRNALLVALAAVGFYKFAPAPGEDVAVTRWIKQYSASREEILEQNANHTALSKASADSVMLSTDAKRERVHRYRYPQALDMVSPHLNRVGQTPDFSSVPVRSA